MRTRSLVPFAIVLLVLTAAVALNPSATQHRARLKASIADRSPVAGVLGLGALTAFASTYHPLGVASYTTVGDQVASVGAFGIVYVRELSASR